MTARVIECAHVEFTAGPLSAAGPFDDEVPVGHVPAYNTQAR